MATTIPNPTDMCIIVTYRCPMQCQMCNIWKNPTQKEKEITLAEIKKLPSVKFINITGGEPFVREDLEEIIEICFQKSPRVVISTSGWFEDRIIKMTKRFPNIGIRISIEGIKDIGFGITVSNHNSADMLSLYQLSKSLGMEFATAAFHNSYYFHKEDNYITNQEEVCNDFKTLIEWQLKEKHPKSWFRAYFNMGLINYIHDNQRLLPCEAGLVNFFVDPYGEIYPCNGLEDKFWKESMGNIRQSGSFYEIWHSEQAEKIRQKVRNCPKHCWMVGTVSPVMKKYISQPLKWVVRNKWNILTGKPIQIELNDKK